MQIRSNVLVCPPDGNIITTRRMKPSVFELPGGTILPSEYFRNMWELILGAVVLFLAVFYTLTKQSSVPKIHVDVPGLDPVTKSDGNFPDIGSAGSLHQFLLGLHKTYGPVAKFWWGSQMVVSVGSPKLFKQVCRLFDRPSELFAMFRPLIGDGSIQYANFEDGRRRHTAYSKCFSVEMMKQHFDRFNEVSNEVLSKWSNKEPIALQECSMSFAIKTLLLCTMGTYFESEANISRILDAYTYMWGEMGSRLRTGTPQAGGERMKKFEEQKLVFLDVAKNIWRHRKENPPGAGDFMLIDAILELDMDEDKTFSDIISTMIASFHTTGLMLTWTLYYLASHPDVQERLYKEAHCALGDEPVDHENMKKLTYMTQVLNEALRCSVLAPFAARFNTEDMDLAGYTVSAKTPVIISLGTVLQDPVLYPNPERFDPDRFSAENISRRPSFAFEPFGFAGKRKCPGYRFSMTEGIVLLADITRRFEVTLVEGQAVTPVHGLVTTPKEEIWVNVHRRN